MSDWNELFDDPGKLEECFMSAAEGADDRLALLNQFLESVYPAKYAQWPSEIQEAWNGGVELLADAITSHVENREVRKWLHLTAASGFDSAVFRDALAVGLRAAFADYLDPAGMIAALGIHDPTVTTERVSARWERFAHLAEGNRCCHAAYGAGVIDDVDPLTSEVRVRFDRVQAIPLDVFLDTVQMVRKDSPLALLLAGRGGQVAAGQDGLLTALCNSLVPPGGDERFFKRILVPGIMNERQFSLAVSGQGAERTGTAGDDQGGRTVAAARSAQELAEVLKTTRHYEPADGDIENIDRLLLQCAGRPEQAELLRDIIVRLWHLCRQTDWLVRSLRENLAGSVAWQDREIFVKLTDEASGRSVDCWLSAAALAVGAERFFELAIRLPLRLWPVVEQVAADLGLSRQRLVDTVVAALRTSDATADMALWLWKSDAPEKTVLRDVVLIMKALGNPVKGAFIRANRDLHKLLVTSEAFHRFMVEGRSTDSSRALVRAIEHSAVLDSGERQSMLVRLVRSFPELRAIIEKRNAPVKKKAMPRMTSIRSYEARRLELEEIINVKIPGNSRAIATAREHGDLRENAEYKAAKDEQAYLTARRNELESDLDEVRAYDFTLTSDFNQITPGCSFEIQTADGRRQRYLLLGLWDSVPEKNMLSYETPLGMAVLSAKVGDDIEMPTGDVAAVVDIGPLPSDILEWLNEPAN